jgi:hypothetical protein
MNSMPNRWSPPPAGKYRADDPADQVPMTPRSQSQSPTLQFQTDLQLLLTRWFKRMPDLDEAAKNEITRLMTHALGEAEAEIRRAKAS